MTPELKIACEVVFQEHKVSSHPIKWNRDAFHGRISIGLSEMAKVTLVKKNIILLPNKSKKIITLLNPVVAAAASFEEAEEMIENKVPALVASMADDHPTYIAGQVSGFVSRPSAYSHRLLPIGGNPEAQVAEIKWYLKPLFYYVVWPVCAAAAGALIAFLIDLIYTELFLNMKY
jgi:hypothetical protein